MKLLISKDNQNIALLLALTDDDAKVLQYLWDKNSIFGNYQLDSPPFDHNELATKLLSKYPDIKLISHININEGFIPKKDKVEDK